MTQPPSSTLPTLHVIAHTHWDREWYLTFQQMRIKLVHLIDGLMDILSKDPSFGHFMLDGQTIVLEDYLAIRPERSAEIERHVREGRILIGPWYVLPDEFLVSPEAMIRNMLRGAAISRRFGGRMDVGYIPDPFGHIGQMPQILAGFGIASAALRRGLADEPCEVWWEGADGTRVLTAYLRDGYDNAARLPSDATAFNQSIDERIASLMPHALFPELLLMNGTDHQEPQPELPELIRQRPGTSGRMLLSTLPAYFEALRFWLASGHHALPTVRGELRNPKRHHLLPGVASSRVWIKQRNHSIETILERWAEPFASWAECLPRPSGEGWLATGLLTTPRVRHPQALIEEAWRMLMECHPHDSICGCSIDAVHEEMRTRFDQAEQVAEEVTRESLQAIAASVDTRSFADQGALGAIVVFNPLNGPRSGLVRAQIASAAGLSTFEIVDAAGNPVPYRMTRTQARPLAELELDADGLRGMLLTVRDGRVMGMVVADAAVVTGVDRTTIDVMLAEEGEPALDQLRSAMAKLEALLADGVESTFHLQARLPAVIDMELLARSVPAHGWAAFGLRPVEGATDPRVEEDSDRIENEILSVQARPDGSVTLIDRRSGEEYAGLLRLRDEGDRGDSYNFCPVEGDAAIESSVGQAVTHRSADALGQTLHITTVYRLPSRLGPGRSSRAFDTVEMPVDLTLTLVPGLPMLEVEVRLDNRAEDHRIQALFPLGRSVDEGIYDGAFEIVRRPTQLPVPGSDWVEQPRPEGPMRAFVAAHAGRRGLMVAARGLREASVSPDGELALTLLRSFGWLSRSDLATRTGAAGPELETPGGQDLGNHVFHLALIPFQEDPLAAAQCAYDYQAGMRAAYTTIHAGGLAVSGSFLSWDSPAFELTAVKPADAGTGVIVRGVNLSDEQITVHLTCAFPLARVVQVRLDEKEITELVAEDRKPIEVTLGPHALLTLRLELVGDQATL